MIFVRRLRTAESAFDAPFLIADWILDHADFKVEYIFCHVEDQFEEIPVIADVIVLLTEVMPEDTRVTIRVTEVVTIVII